MSNNVGTVNVTITGDTRPLQQSLDEATGESNDFASKVGGKLKDFSVNVGKALQVYAVAAIAALGAAMVATAVKASNFASEVNTAMKQVQAQTGASAEEMVGLKESMLDVYSSGLAESLEESAQAMSLVKRITGETGDALTETTTDALALSKAFDGDIKETVAATDAVMVAFGKSASDSMDLMAYAIQRTGDPANDLMATFQEYSPLMSQIGLSAEQFTAGLIGGLEAGAFNTDVLADSMKEFSISLMQDAKTVAGPALAEALAAGGDAGAQAWLNMQDEIEKASGDVDDHKSALDKATEEWQSINDQVQGYQDDLDKAFQKLVKLQHPDWDLSSFTDQIDILEGKKLQMQLEINKAEQAGQDPEAQKEQLKQIDMQIDQQRLLMEQEQRRLDQQVKAKLAAEGFNEKNLAGLVSEKEGLNEVSLALSNYAYAQQSLDNARPELNAAQANMDAAQASYQKAVDYLQNLKVQNENMPNPGEQLALDFQAGGEKAKAAMKKMADAIIQARAGMGDLDFKAYLRKIGLGTMAEEMSAEAFMGFWKGVANPGDIVSQAAGTTDEIAKNMADRWGAVWSQFDQIFLPLGEKLQIAFSRVLPVMERLVQYASLKLPPVLEKIGNAIDNATNKILPTLERVGMNAIAQLTPMLEWLANWVSSELPKWADWIYNNSTAISSWAATFMSLGAMLGAGGIVGGALAWLISTAAALWAALAPVVGFLTGGAVTASLASLGAALGTFALPLAIAGAALAAFALAWYNDWGNIRETTYTVVGAVVGFIMSVFNGLQVWWAKYGQDVVTVFNAAWGALAGLFAIAIAPIMLALEGFKLFWSIFGDFILSYITTSLNNVLLVFQGIFATIGEVFGIFASAIKGDWAGVWEGFGNIMTIYKETMVGVWNNILGLFGTSIDGIVAFFTGLPARITAAFSPEAMIKIASDAMTAFSNTITSMMPTMPSLSDVSGGLLGSTPNVVGSATNSINSSQAQLTGTIPPAQNNTFQQTNHFPQSNANPNELQNMVRTTTASMLRQVLG